MNLVVDLFRLIVEAIVMQNKNLQAKHTYQQKKGIIVDKKF